MIVWSGGGHACGEAAKEFGITITCPADNVLRWNISNSTDVASGVVEVISAVPFHGQFLYTPGSDGCCEGRTLVIDLTEGELE